MSLALFRLGRFSYRRPWLVIVAWAFILATVVGFVVGSGGGKIASNVTIDGTPSQQVLDELRTQFPAMSGGQGSLVFVAGDQGRLDEGESARALQDAATGIYALDTVRQRPDPMAAIAPPTGAASPAASPAADPTKPHPLTVDGTKVPGIVVSGDGSVAIMQLQLTEPVEDLPGGTIDRIVSIATSHAEGVHARALVSESLKPHSAPLGGSEGLGIAFAALVLILTLGSLRAAVLPLATALIGVGIGLGGALALSHSVELTSATPVLALMVGLAVGMDYALFIVNRTRRLMLLENLSAAEAVPRSIGTAGSAVTFAGLTVVIALTGLTVIGISFLTTMALVAAVTVALAVLIALTLLPALLRLVGEHLVSTRARERAAVNRHTSGVATRWAGRVVRSRGIITAVVVGGLLVMAIPAASMTFGMSDGSTANLHTDERQAYDAVTNAFGPGYNAPLITVVTSRDGARLTAAQLPGLVKGLEGIDGVETVQPLGVSPDGSVAMLTVIPTEGPTSQTTIDLVHTLRDSGAQHLGPGIASVGVAGLTAVNIDISEKLAAVFPYYIAIIVVLSLIVLALVFRSILVPLKATLGFLLSIGATFGAVTAVFQWGWLKDLFGFDTTGPILSFLPIMVTGILYGLAMDYEMFLVSSMREEHVHGRVGNAAVTRGYAQASRVVVAAAVIMVSVFAGFIFSEDPMVKQFGFALAAGITIDAFLIRLTVVPALMSFLGDKAWWMPAWLRRIMPRLDVEGARLADHLRHDEPEPTPQLTTS
jgi:RND superfamily putative drug exporter